MNQEELNKQLFKAASYGDVEGTKKAIQEGANIGSTDRDGRTLLHWAALYGEINLAQFMLNYDPFAAARTDKKGLIPLYYAGLGNRVGIVRYENIARLLIENFKCKHTCDKDEA